MQMGLATRRFPCRTRTRRLPTRSALSVTFFLFAQNERIWSRTMCSANGAVGSDKISTRIFRCLAVGIVLSSNRISNPECVGAEFNIRNQVHFENRVSQAFAPTCFVGFTALTAVLSTVSTRNVINRQSKEVCLVYKESRPSFRSHRTTTCLKCALHFSRSPILLRTSRNLFICSATRCNHPTGGSVFLLVLSLFRPGGRRFLGFGSLSLPFSRILGARLSTVLFVSGRLCFGLSSTAVTSRVGLSLALVTVGFSTSAFEPNTKNAHPQPINKDANVPAMIFCLGVISI